MNASTERNTYWRGVDIDIRLQRIQVYILVLRLELNTGASIRLYDQEQ